MQRFNIQAWGDDNLYPQRLERIAAASGTAELCLSRYAKFIEGYGFAGEQLSMQEINRYGMTVDELLHLIAGDVARFGGFAVHVNYNLLGQVSEINWQPFIQCRLEEEDDGGNVAHIVTHPDWWGKKTRRGRRMAIDERHISRIDVFNPSPGAVMSQIEKAGGIEFYKGQILWCGMSGKSVYPMPVHDAVISEMSTDEGLGNIKCRNARNNFLSACMLVTKKGVPREGDDSMIDPEDLTAFQGDESLGKIMMVEMENDEDEPKVVPFQANNYDKEFSVTDASVIERIYAQFHQELFYSIRIGKLGFSGQVMRDAYEYYAGEVTNEQRFIARNLQKVLAVWHDGLLHNADVTIAPLKYIAAEGNSHV